MPILKTTDELQRAIRNMRINRRGCMRTYRRTSSYKNKISSKARAETWDKAIRMLIEKV